MSDYIKRSDVLALAYWEGSGTTKYGTVATDDIELIPAADVVPGAVYRQTVETLEKIREEAYMRYEQAVEAEEALADANACKRGEWIEHYDADRELWYFNCPFCGDDYSAVTKYLQNFCPNCGADMRGRASVSN